MTQANLDRSSRLAAAESGVFDVLVVGGGIHGASVCRELALHGVKSLLLEARDYASATSSNSSKLLHGGIRYLERGNLRLVYEALRERSYYLRAAPHLTRPLSFLYPIRSGMTRPAWQVQLGLILYEALYRFGGSVDERLLRGASELNLEAGGDELRRLGLEFSSVLSFTDAQMNDARIVIESVIDAARHGATTLNYAKVTGVKRANGMWEVSWHSLFEDTKHASRAKFLVNTAGPWTGGIHTRALGVKPPMVLSRGAHILFDVPQPEYGLILPVGTNRRYYFVLPYFSPSRRGVLVGTTDSETTEPESPLESVQAEVAELEVLLQRDLPAFPGLNKCADDRGRRIFWGTRALIPGKSETAGLSRSHRWIESDSYFALIGGKFTTARNTALECVRGIIGGGAKDLSFDRPLPGGVDFSVATRRTIEDLFLRRLGGEHFQAAADALNRFGARTIKILEHEEKHDLKSILRAQVKHTIENEQAITVSDICDRRLGIEFYNPEIIAYVSEFISDYERTDSLKRDFRLHGSRLGLKISE